MKTITCSGINFVLWLGLGGFLCRILALRLAVLNFPFKYFWDDSGRPLFGGCLLLGGTMGASLSGSSAALALRFFLGAPLGSRP